MVVWAWSSAADAIFKRLATAFASNAAIEETKADTKREPNNRREQTW